MDIKAYISSGIIETYVLGMATAEDAAELLLLAEQYPEIKQALLAEELVMEKLALADAVAPPAHLKEKIGQTLLETASNNFTTGDKTNIVSLKPKSSVVGFWKYLAVAASLLLLISIGFMLVTSNRIKEENTLALQKIEQQKMEQQKELEAMKAEMALVTDPAIKKIPLLGTDAHPQNNATLYWDTRNTDVYLKLHNMPVPQADQQYQLWAIVDGKPIDLGVFGSGDTENLIQKMKSIPQAEMFAITLEKAGGSASPTMDQMYVAAKI